MGRTCGEPNDIELTRHRGGIERPSTRTARVKALTGDVLGEVEARDGLERRRDGLARGQHGGGLGGHSVAPRNIVLV